ncbi:MAG: LytTR family DNA-binding domain-containing protein [Eubacteriales bacterium]|nr:LytTR family DNA-binding domain-containing protein [Eubacteriales bacterium]
MHVAICDDNQTDTRLLVSMIAGSHDAAVFSSAETLLLELEEAGKRFDFYLLDIFMEKMDGLELAKRIRLLDNNALICFVSTSDDFYREAFDLYAFQYLVKPVDQGDFQRLLNRASERLAHDREHSVTLTWRGKSKSVPYGRILFIFSSGHTLYIQCKDGQSEHCTGKLDHLAAQLNSSVFVRCHQSYMVNLYNVDALEGDDFVCQGLRVPISRRYSHIKTKYRTLLFEEMR